SRTEHGGRNLIQERLKNVMVLSVEHCHIDGLIGQSLRGPESAKTAPYDHNFRSLFHSTSSHNETPKPTLQLDAVGQRDRLLNPLFSLTSLSHSCPNVNTKMDLGIIYSLPLSVIVERSKWLQ